MVGAGTLLAWWNLAYVIPFGFGLLFLAMQLSGLGETDSDMGEVDGEVHAEIEADAGVDADVHADVDVDADADVDMDVHADVDMDVHGDLDVDAHADVDMDVHADVDAHADVDVHGDLDADGHLPAEADHGDLDGHLGLDGVASGLMKFGMLLGVGKVPLSTLFMTLCFTWGFFGYVNNLWLSGIFPAPGVFFTLSALLTAVVSFGSTSIFARAFARLVPTYSSFHTRESQLVGRLGEALYVIKPGSTGTLRVRDAHGNLLQYPAFHDEEGPIRGGTPILLLRWSGKRKAFEVETAPPELLGAAGEDD